MRIFKGLRLRIPKIKATRGVGLVLASFFLASATAVVSFALRGDSSTWWDAWAASVATSFAVGWILIRLGQSRFRDLPNMIRRTIIGFGIFSVWLLAGQIYQTFLRSGFDEAFHAFAIGVCIPFAQGMFFGWLFWVGDLLGRDGPKKS